MGSHRHLRPVLVQQPVLDHLELELTDTVPITFLPLNWLVKRLGDPPFVLSVALPPLWSCFAFHGIGVLRCTLNISGREAGQPFKVEQTHPEVRRVADLEITVYPGNPTISRPANASSRISFFCAMKAVGDENLIVRSSRACR